MLKNKTPNKEYVKTKPKFKLNCLRLDFAQKKESIM